MDDWAYDSLKEAIDLLAISGRSDLASDLNRVLEASDFDQREMLRNPEADDLLDSILEVDTASALSAVLQRLREIIKVDHCTIHIVKESASQFYRTQVLTTYPNTWVDYYVSEEFHKIDPILNHSQFVSEGFFWDEFQTSAPSSEAFFRKAQKFGVGPSGYTTIITTEGGGIFGVSVTSSMAHEAFRMHLERHIPDLTILASYIAEAFVGLFSDAERTGVQLSDDQILVLRGIAEGMTWDEVRQIETKFGNFQSIARSICEVFETNSIIQATIYAARLGLLDVPPITVRNVFTATSRGTGGELFQADNIASIQRWANLKRKTQSSAKSFNVVSIGDPAWPA